MLEGFLFSTVDIKLKSLYVDFTLSIIAKMRSTLFSGVFSSSGSSTVFPCNRKKLKPKNVI